MDIKENYKENSNEIESVTATYKEWEIKIEPYSFTFSKGMFPIEIVKDLWSIHNKYFRQS
jgi:hypothetical protein